MIKGKKHRGNSRKGKKSRWERAGDTKSLIAGQQVLLYIARKTMAMAAGLGLNRH